MWAAERFLLKMWVGGNFLGFQKSYCLSKAGQSPLLPGGDLVMTALNDPIGQKGGCCFFTSAPSTHSLVFVLVTPSVFPEEWGHFEVSGDGGTAMGTAFCWMWGWNCPWSVSCWFSLLKRIESPLDSPPFFFAGMQTLPEFFQEGSADGD